MNEFTQSVFEVCRIFQSYPDHAQASGVRVYKSRGHRSADGQSHLLGRPVGKSRAARLSGFQDFVAFGKKNIFLYKKNRLLNFDTQSPHIRYIILITYCGPVVSAQVTQTYFLEERLVVMSVRHISRAAKRPFAVDRTQRPVE